MAKGKPGKPDKSKPGKGTRRGHLDELRRQQKAAERRQSLLIIGVFGVIGVLIVGAAAWTPVANWINDPARKEWSEFGVSPTAAACGEPIADGEAVEGVHLDGQDLVYETAPAVAGDHWGTPAPFGRKFYTMDDRPAVEMLVHNLEHGYTILWYDETVAEDADQVRTIEDISRRFRGDTLDDKFIAAPWESERGDFPEDMHIAMTRWTVSQGGVRQYCEQVSGEAVEAFMAEFPVEDSPEPNGM